MHTKTVYIVIVRFRIITVSDMKIIHTLSHGCSVPFWTAWLGQLCKLSADYEEKHSNDWKFPKIECISPGGGELPASGVIKLSSG